MNREGWVVGSDGERIKLKAGQGAFFEQGVYTVAFLMGVSNLTMSTLNWKIGIEIELMAPRGLSRQDLAVAIAQKYEGTVISYFHPQSEPSQVPGCRFLRT
ncbi:hypothetical protein NIES4071_43710 [Calothrix sp. NIES-4071]|nr:hypothetical protein NIES4071_43710 [Calothrix sp. NIES-4071]BAZ58685.1 hypothetical protein NIES4105_43640 [Calothrix sp. NIES-4105]